jgi:hypothetical protein
MRKRSKYRPRYVQPNPMAYVMAGMMKVADVPTAGVELLARNEAALDEVIQGRGNDDHAEILITMANCAESLELMKISEGWMEEIKAAQAAVESMRERGHRTGRFVFTGPEMEIVKDIMTLHTQQLQKCSIRDMEKVLLGKLN